MRASDAGLRPLAEDSARAFALRSCGESSVTADKLPTVSQKTLDSIADYLSSDGDISTQYALIMAEYVADLILDDLRDQLGATQNCQPHDPNRKTS